MNKKVMMIGLDGGTWTLLNRWISDNKLPTFKKIINSGSKAILKSTIPSSTGPALASMFTGMNPGNHGILSKSFLKPDGSLGSLSEIEYPRIWNILDINGRYSCIINVRFTYPPEKINGLMLSGFAPFEKANYIYPEYMRDKVKGFKNDKREKIIYELKKARTYKEGRKKLFNLSIDYMRTRYNIFKKLNKEIDYDFSILWIGETDILQHWCWECKKLLLKLYTEIDYILKDIILNFSKKNLFIVSDHGFYPTPKEFFYVNTWLQREGMLYKKPFPPLHHIINIMQHFGYYYTKPRLLYKILTRVRNISRRKNNASKFSIDRLPIFPGIDNNNTKAYLSTTYGININDSFNYSKIRNKIISKLQKLKNKKGEKVIKGIWKKEEIYKGKYIEEIPDIIFLVSKKYQPFPSLVKNLFGEIKRKDEWLISGHHERAREGIFIAYGTAIKRNNDIGCANIEDITPTILHLMGIGIPIYTDGNILNKIYKKNSDPANRNPVFKEYITISKKTFDISKEDKEEILERLRKLGYL